MRGNYFVLPFLICISCASLCQPVRYNKVVIKSTEEFILISDSTFIDTLVMEDNSVLRFVLPDNVLIVESVSIGMNCLFDASGGKGRNATPIQINGEDAENGKNLFLALNIKNLESLVIDTHGGEGGNGLSGSAGQGWGAYSKNGGNGGSGGNGGNVTFYYLCSDFVVNINRPMMKHSVELRQNSGKGGKGGQGGKVDKGGESVRISSTTPPDPKVLGTRTYNNYTPIIPAGSAGSAGRNGEQGELKFLKLD